MLNQSLQEILYKDKKVIGIKDGDKVAYCDQLIINPVYLVDIKEDTRLSLIGKVIWVICILDHPIIKNTNSAQIIIPSKQIDRHNDIYIM